MGGKKIAQVIETDVDEALKWLIYEGQNKRLGAILALKQLLVEAPYITFNRIFLSKNEFLQSLGIYREKKQEIRLEILEFIDVCI